VGDATVSGELSASSVISDLGTFGNIKVNADATVAGKLSLGNLEVSTDATIDGTLYADRVTTKFGDINEKLETIEASVSAISNIQPTPYPPQSESSTSALLALGATLLGDTDSHVEISKDITLTQSLAVFGETLLGKTSIAGTLLVNGTIRIADDSIDTSGSTLYLQKDRLANLDIMGGTIVVNTLGNVVINGNLNLTGDLTVGGVLGVNHIRAANGDLTIDLPQTNPDSTTSGFAKLIVIGANNQTVASIDANGNISSEGNITARSATISGDLSVSKLAIPAFSEGNLSATDSANTSSTIGQGTLLAGLRSITIANTRVTAQSLIYITPITSTGNQVLYVSDKVPGLSFTVAIDSPLSAPVEFNWWIIN
jgi:cytoskeletal protein CcmA (bactofilin family)